MEDFKNFIMKPPIKSIVVSLLTFFTSVTLAFLGEWDKTQEGFVLKIILFFISIALYIVVLSCYATNEVNDRRVAALREAQIKTFESLLTDIVSICSLNSKDFNACLNKIKDSQQIDLNVWSFDKACNGVCDLVYNCVCRIGESRDFAISYVKAIEDKKDTVMLNGFANKSKAKPSVYKEERRFDINDGNNTYHDLELFKKNSSDMDIMITSEEIDAAFGYRNKESRKNNKGKYRQYIAIPVFCNDTKMIGLLEIAALKDAKIALTREEVEEIANKYFLPYVNILLIMYKMEKALYINNIKRVN